MKKLFTLLTLVAITNSLFAASYRTFLGHSVSGNTYTIYLNSDTAVGENGGAEISYTPSGGGATVYTGFVAGTYGPYTVSGTSAHWKVEITLPSGATNLEKQLITRNESNNLYGHSGFSPMGVVLSVETANIEAKKVNNTTLLTWQTASEKDNALFQIERSANATDFSPIGEVKGAGSLATTKNYTFTDVAPLSGVNYYRLKAVDYNGSATLSKVVSVNFSGKNDGKIAVYPNPTRNVLQVDVNATEAATTLVQVTDLMGRVVLSQNVTVNKGANLLPFNVAALPSGAYFVKINGDVARFVKQ